MVSYIIRRLFAAIGLVIVISMITFAIFYLIPRLPARRRRRWPRATSASRPNPGQLQAAAESLGFYDPMPVQYWHWLHRSVAGRDVDNGTAIDHCPAPCLGYSFRTNQPVLPEIQNRFPVTLSLAVGAADHLADHGRHHRRASPR